MKKRAWWTAGLTLGFAGLLAAGAAWAQHDPVAGGLLQAWPELRNRPVGRFLRAELPKLKQLREELKLADEQRKAVHERLGAHRDEFRAVVDKLRAGHQKVVAASQAEPFDEQAVRAAVSELSAPLGDAAVLRAKVMREVKTVLTPEQVQKLEAFRKDAGSAAGKALEGAL
ncbi:MAG: Spy/CpxP family protein refolding chaperone [Armatimonadetes bacterium]|nr:Spy/CpxP family protein refolding chaperone [Armatimonadota bacterium]